MTKQRDAAARERAEQKITQHLFEAHALEMMVVNTLSAHVAVTPAGAYRSGLETHLEESLDHASRIQRHLAKRNHKRSLVQIGYGLALGAVNQVLAVGKAPIDMARGTSGEEMLLKNLRDECASEAAEIATYLVIEQYAREIGDTATERLAASIRADEERMLERLFEQTPRLVADAVAADVDDNPQFVLSRIGAIDGVRSVASAAARTVARRTRRASRRVDVQSASSARTNRPQVTTPRASSSIARSSSAKPARSTSKPRKAASSNTRTEAKASRPNARSKARSTAK